MLGEYTHGPADARQLTRTQIIADLTDVVTITGHLQAASADALTAAQQLP
jgi:hypothetical protein